MSGPNLFGHKEKAEKPKRTKATLPTGTMQKLINLRVSLFEQRFGEPPVILDSDLGFFARLVRQFGIEKVEQRFRMYCAWDDPYVVETGFSIDGFYRQWNRLTARAAAETPTADAARATADYLTRLKAH